MTITLGTWQLIFLGIFIVVPALFVYLMFASTVISDIVFDYRRRKEREKERREFNQKLSRHRSPISQK